MVFLLVRIDHFYDLFPHIKNIFATQHQHHLLLKDVLTVEQHYRHKSKVTNNDCNDSDICKHTVNRNSNLNDNTTCTLGIKCTGQYELNVQQMLISLEMLDSPKNIFIIKPGTTGQFQLSKVYKTSISPHVFLNRTTAKNKHDCVFSLCPDMAIQKVTNQTGGA